MGSRAPGSSPRVRGKPGCGAWPRRRWRLIPARAGKTRVRAPRRREGAAHPRACGENGVYTGFRVSNSGSSPRVRGKLRRRHRRPHRARLIPARAGKTPSRQPPASAGGAHPRACGENEVVHELGPGRSGSSPRVRGKRRDGRRRESPPRLIPARAGKTQNYS